MANDVPKTGVTLWYKSAKRRTSPAGKKMAELILDCTIEGDDDDIWKSIEQTFVEGFHVSRLGDFKDGMIDVLKAALYEAEEKNKILTMENSRLAGDNKVLRSQNAALITRGGHDG